MTSIANPINQKITALFTLSFVAVVILMAAAVPLQAQGHSPTTGEPAVTHNTWTSGAPMPTAVEAGAAAVLSNEIYVVGGASGSGGTGLIADTQIYNPVTNAWSTGVSFPTTISAASAAVVKNVLYVIGGSSDGQTATNAVWAYNPKTKTWTSKAAMPTARFAAAIAVETNIVYVIGGYNGSYLSTVESYNPATDSWTEKTPRLVTGSNMVAGLLGSLKTGYTIVATDGANAPSSVTGDTEGYDAAKNTWSELTADPSPRMQPCGGSIGSKFYAAGGYLNNGGAAGTVNESYQLSKNKWTTLAAMPQGTMVGASAVYKGKLYCFGGWATWLGSPVNNVQIYQP